MRFSFDNSPCQQGKSTWSERTARGARVKSAKITGLAKPAFPPLAGAAAFLATGGLWLGLGKRIEGNLTALGLLLAGSAVVYGGLKFLSMRHQSADLGLDDLPDAVFQLDRDGLIRQWNQAAEELVGDSLFYCGQSFIEIAVIESQASLAEALSATFKQGRAMLEVRLSNAEGMSVPCLATTRLLTGESGVIVALRPLPAESRQNSGAETFRQMVELSPYLAAVVADSRIVWINRAGALMLGANAPDDLLRQPWADFLMPSQDDQPPRLRRLDGVELEVDLTSCGTLFEDHPAILIEARDLSSLSNATSRLEDCGRRIQGMMHAVDDAVVMVDQRGQIQGFNPAAEILFGHPAREVVSEDLSLLLPQDDAKSFLEAFRNRAAGSEKTLRRRYEVRGRRRDGSSFPAQLTQSEIRDGGKRMFTLVIRDVSERKALYSRLAMTEKVLESTSEGVILSDANGNILWVNGGFSRISGYSRDEAIGKTTKLLRSGLQGPSFYKTMWDALLQDGEWAGEIWNRRKDGEAYPEWLTIKAIHDENGQPERYVGVFSDISKHKRAQETIRHLTYYDPVTRLPNRYLFQDRLGQAMERARRSDRRVALVLVSLDRFKTINETLGHQMGDALLREVAQRLTASVRGEDTVSRLRGDTFCCALAELNHTHDANPVINRILDSFASAFDINGHELFITASLGISLFPLDGSEIDDLLQKAESAVNRSKERAENTYHFYTPEMNANSMERLRLETDLRKAVNRGELILYYQPKVEIETGKLVGAEALVRWRHPEYGMVPPARFIPIAEDTGLILPIGSTVLQQACQQLKSWLDQGLTPVPVAVNLSAHQFRQNDMVQAITSVIADSNLPPGLIELELTESSVMRNADSAVMLLNELHGMGLSIAIDDFGTGYSSLSYLKKFPIDRLKIDRSFVQDLGTSQAGEEIVGAIIAMAHSLKMSVIAEGVENSQQLQMLRELKCEEVQGFYYSRPVPAEEFAQFLAAGTLTGRDTTSD